METPHPLPSASAREIRAHFEDEAVHATLVHFLNLGKHLDPFSNWLLAGSAAVLVYVMDKFGGPDAAFGRGLSLVLVILLVLSIGAGFLARFLSFQGLVMAHQWSALPADLERVRDQYRVTVGVNGAPLDTKRITDLVRTMLRTEGTRPTGFLGWLWWLIDRTVEILAPGKPMDFAKLDPKWHGIAIAARGVERVLPLIVAQMFFLLLATLCGIGGVFAAWISR